MGVAGLFLVAGALATAGIGQAAGEPAPLVFSGEATASGVRVTVQAPEAPLTNTPFDAGAPTAYAQLDTIGRTNAYAAYPFPGTVFQSGPGIAVGLLNQSGVPVPSPPGFPNYVASDGTTPSAESGSGPYHLKATSTPTKADALATGGIRSDGNGSVGLATATGHGRVARRRRRRRRPPPSAPTRRLTIGPLTIGSVRSRVTSSSRRDGAATPDTELGRLGRTDRRRPDLRSPRTGSRPVVPQSRSPTDPALTAALAQAGLSVELVAGRHVDKGCHRSSGPHHAPRSRRPVSETGRARWSWCSAGRRPPSPASWRRSPM